MRPCETLTIALFYIMLLLPATDAIGEEYVTEPASGLKFVTEADDGLVLLGVGIRKFLMVKGYATAMYVDAEGFKGAVSGRSVEEMGQNIQFGSYHRRLLIQFLRSVSADRVKKVFRAALKKSMTPGDYATEAKEIERFLDGCWKLEKGDIFTLESSGGRTKIYHGSRLVYEGDHVLLNRGMWGGYFGKTPVSEQIRETMLKRAALILGQ